MAISMTFTLSDDLDVKIMKAAYDKGLSKSKFIRLAIISLIHRIETHDMDYIFDVLGSI
jgi:predicted transcriptional regulator